MTKLRAEIIRLGKDPAYTRAVRLLRALIFSMFMAIGTTIAHRGGISSAIAAFVTGVISFLLVYSLLGTLGKSEQGGDSGAAPDPAKQIVAKGHEKAADERVTSVDSKVGHKNGGS